MEENVLEFWDKSETFKKSIEKEAPKGDYVFYDGPPFATGTPHYGHIVASVMKDVIPRYWTMKGFRVERKWGWDCHGLPIENIVEKKLGSKNKKDIEAMGVDKFNEACRAEVFSYVAEWEKTIKKLGRWADMKNPYRTMDLEFMESVWWVFKELWDKDLIYKDHRSIHICPRCETTLSQSEVAEGYKDIKDLSVTAKFELVDEPGTFILAWTTTPWTLIGNVALAVGADLEYVKARIPKKTVVGKNNAGSYSSEPEYIYIAKSIIENFEKDATGYMFPNSDKTLIVEGNSIKGSDLVGKKYKPLFDYYSNDKKLVNRENGWQIYAGDFVTTEEGTGVVHIAPAFGTDDMELGRQHNLPFVQHLGMDGIIRKEAKDFAGLSVKPLDDHMKTDIEIIKYLAHNGLLFHKEKYEHSYPHCWRCDTPLLNYATDSWFVAVSKIKDDILKNAEPINWTPEHIKKGRWGNWLEGARDWSISRQRFWASVIPIWECSEQKCDYRKVFGSVKELEELSGAKITDLHKHVVDKITFKCEKCGGVMKRVPDVLDTWFDSGSMPYAQKHYPFENKEKFDASFPAEFIAEGSDQTRAWFYYLHVIASGIKNSNAFKNVIVNGIVLAEDGKKMSKRLKNYPDPNYLIDQYGADALRYYLLTSSVMLTEDLNFSEKGVVDIVRKLNMILLNVYKFYDMFSSDFSGESIDCKESKNILDQWILLRLNQLHHAIGEGMEKYNLPQATRPIAIFIDDLSTWYIRRSRDRFKSDDLQDKNFALATTRYVLSELSRLIAPFVPFISEQIWQKVNAYNFEHENKSVHLEIWPELISLNDDQRKILKEMEVVRKIVELGFAKRDEAGIKVRQPLFQLIIKNYELKDEYKNLLLDELNIKDIKSEMGEGDILVELDTKITEELKLEGFKREMVRIINNIRKNQGLVIADNIKVHYKTSGENIKKVIADIELKQELLKDVLAEDIIDGIDESVENQKNFKVNDEEAIFIVEKIK
jgi:isoleucyl-tRNA synthetase